MKAEISTLGLLIIISENSTENYAINKWTLEDNIRDGNKLKLEIGKDISFKLFEKNDNSKT